MDTLQISNELRRQGHDLTTANAYAASGILPHDAPASHGAIRVANSERFTESFFSQPLTTFAVGYKDEADLDAAIEFYAPKVPTSRRFEFMTWTNAEQFLSDASADDLRAIGGEFKRVVFTSTKTNGRTDNRGLTMRVDLDQVAETPNWQERYTALLLKRLKRSVLRRAVAALSAAATNTAKTWVTTAAVDADSDVVADLVTATTASGIKPNRVGYGDTSWSKRLLGLRYPSGTNPSLAVSAAMTPDQLAGFLGVDQVFIDKARYQSSSSAKSEVTSNLVLMFRADGGGTLEDPSNIKRFVSLTDSGGDFKVFIQQVTGKLFDITVEHYDAITITSTLGIRKFTVS